MLELAEKLKKFCDVAILSSTKVNDLCKPVFSLSRGEISGNKCLNKFVKGILGNFSSAPDVVIEHLSSFMPVFFELMKNDYDVLFPNNDWGGLMVASAVRKIKGTPIIFTEHNGLVDKGKSALRNLRFLPDRYIVLSNEMEFWVKRNFPQVNVRYIPNGVNLERFNSNVSKQYFDLEGPIILAAGKNKPFKRLEYVINAVSKLKKGSLLMLSSGENLDILEDKGCKLLGNERFKLLSASYSEMPSYYKSCDVFTLPSIQEPFGLVYLEAMACNKPVVAPDDYSRMDIIGEAGILCDVRDIDAYANSLKIAARSDFGSIPINQAKKFSWDICAERYFETISSLIA